MAGRKWFIDLCNKDVLPESLEPLGYNRGIVAEQGSTGDRAAAKEEQKQKELKQKRAYEIAMAPGKNLFMTAFMLWMSGSSINIFTIMMTGMALMGPIKAVFNTNSAFAKLDDGSIDLLLPKITYLGVNAIGLAMGVYKLGTLGLLPLTSADWTWLLPEKKFLEASALARPLGVEDVF